MSRYSYIPQPNPATSPVYGQATRLVPVPSYGAQMLPAIPAATAAAAPAAAAAGTRSLGMAFLSDVLANMLSGGIQAATAGATGALTPATTQGGSNSRFMITLADVRDIQQYVDNENFKRKLMGRTDLLDAEDIVREREAQLRRSAAEAGAREYAIEQLKQQGAIQSALAGTAGQALTSAGGVMQQGLSSLGGVAQQGISSALSRPDYGSMISEIGRAY